MCYNINMKIINESFDNKEFFDLPHVFYFANMKIGVFDIETTGLSPHKCQLILSGFIISDKNNIYKKQFFAESLEDEIYILKETIEILEELDVVVTYNGAKFDIPFVLQRAKFHNLPIKKLPYNLDIYKIVRSYSDIGKFTPNLKQKTLENYIGLWKDRADTISGKESVDLYFYYLNSGDKYAENKILLHNGDDIAQLYRLLPVLKQTDFHRAMYFMGFPIAYGVIKTIKINRNTLELSGVFYDNNRNYKCYNDESGYTVDFFNGKFDARIELIHSQQLTFINLEKMYASIEYFNNCGALIENHLILADNNNLNHLAINTISKYLMERIIKNELC